MSAIKVSIAMATYNGLPFIEEQLESLAVQSRLPDELVVNDDCSRDETAAAVTRFARAAPFPVKFERNTQNLGFNGNFAHVLSRCAGDILLISDQDDIWYPNKISEVVEAFSKHPEILGVIHDEHITGNNFEMLPETFLDNLRRVGYPEAYFVAGNCTAIRRSALPLLLPIPDGANYDGWIAEVLDVLGARLVLHKPLILYRRHDRNATQPELACANPSAWAIAAKYRLADARAGWAREVMRLRELRSRLLDQTVYVDTLIGAARSQLAINKIETKILRVEKRIGLVDRGRLARLPFVLQLWSTGFYSQFAGWKSALKDLIRPSH